VPKLFPLGSLFVVIHVLINFVSAQVLRYTQGDLNRMCKELELEFQAQLLAKERDWTLKYDEQRREHEKKCEELAAEKHRCIEKVQRLQKSHEDMK
jgi:predicted Holliday junction resolvase-like endonuclease